jgi:catechol 2,3-dioxygenase-like lactoylglutathione lyase family enzyme
MLRRGARQPQEVNMPSLDAIGIVSSNLAASIAFYRLLGLEFPETTEDHVEATTPGGLRVMLDNVELMKQLNPDWVTPSGHPIGLAFLCSSPAEVDETYDRVVGAGHHGKTAPWDAPWGQRYATVLDPDGNQVDLFAPLG